MHHILGQLLALAGAGPRNELESMKETMRLRVVFVLEEADDSLSAEKGRICEDLPERHFPTDGRADFEFFICGPAPMMDVAERFLTRKGVSPAVVHSERFDIA
jgi:ferredoxin-NADP reductase